MKFEHYDSMPAGFIENTRGKVERYGLDLIVTPEELEHECEGDPNCEKALSEMYRYTIRYASDVWNMKTLVNNKNNYSDDEWATQLAKADSDRTSLHNTMIDSIAILSRALNRAERNNDWVKKLAPNGQLERALCGKFAIMLSYALHVNGLTE